MKESGQGRTRRITKGYSKRSPNGVMEHDRKDQGSKKKKPHFPTSEREKTW